MALCAVLALVSAADAATDEEKCLAGRAKAKGKFEQCIQTVLSKSYGASPLDQAGIAKCVASYDAAWVKLQKLTDSTSCVGERITDDGVTFTDRLTGLVWEKKTDLGDQHDIDNGYNLNFSGTDDGSAYSIFLKALNDAAFGGAHAWRLPAASELLTLVNQTIPGGDTGARYWTTTVSQSDASRALTVRRDGFAGFLIEATEKFGAQYVRAVRGGF